MTTPFYCWDDPADAPVFYPFSQSRPLGELRYGIRLLRERWELAAGRRAAGHLAAAHLAAFTEPEAPGVVVAAAGPCLVGRSTFVPDPAADLSGEGPLRLVDDTGTLVGALVPDGAVFSPAAAAGWPARTIPGRQLAGVWQIIADLDATLADDLARLRESRPPATVPRGAIVIGDPALVVADEAIVEPQVVFDVRNGPVVLDRGVEVRTFTRLQGPLYAGPGTRLVGGQLRHVSIGPRCVVHGEVSNCVFLGYANKGHDGFLGHSIVGRWVNLGAGTITSNLKNTYGPVRVNLGPARIDTGMTFLGALFGDHVKTAIGTMLPTGCVVGTGANLFGDARPGAQVPPFAWGTAGDGRVVACRMFLQTAGRVLPRRDVALDEPTRAWLTAVWQLATGQTCD